MPRCRPTTPSFDIERRCKCPYLSSHCALRALCTQGPGHQIQSDLVVLEASRRVKVRGAADAWPRGLLLGLTLVLAVPEPAPRELALVTLVALVGLLGL